MNFYSDKAKFEETITSELGDYQQEKTQGNKQEKTQGNKQEKTQGNNKEKTKIFPDFVTEEEPPKCEQKQGTVGMIPVNAGRLFQISPGTYLSSLALDNSGNLFAVGTFQDYLKLENFECSKPGINLWLGKLNSKGIWAWVSILPKYTGTGTEKSQLVLTTDEIYMASGMINSQIRIWILDLEGQVKKEYLAENADPRNFVLFSDPLYGILFGSSFVGRVTIADKVLVSPLTTTIGTANTTGDQIIQSDFFKVQGKELPLITSFIVIITPNTVQLTNSISLEKMGRGKLIAGTSNSGFIYLAGLFIGNLEFRTVKLVGTEVKTFLIKMKNSGEIGWGKAYTGNVQDLKVDSDQNIFMILSQKDTLVVEKIDRMGNIIWSRHIYLSETDYSNVVPIPKPSVGPQQLGPNLKTADKMMISYGGPKPLLIKSSKCPKESKKHHSKKKKRPLFIPALHDPNDFSEISNDQTFVEERFDQGSTHKSIYFSNPEEKDLPLTEVKIKVEIPSNPQIELTGDFIYIKGFYPNNKVTFDQDLELQTTTKNGFYLACLNYSGKWIWALGGNGNPGISGRRMISDSQNYLYLAGGSDELISIFEEPTDKKLTKNYYYLIKIKNQVIET